MSASKTQSESAHVEWEEEREIAILQIHSKCQVW